MPIRLIWRGAEPIVEWCYLGQERFTHPFFDTTIQLALETPFNRLFRHHTTMAALEEWTRQSPGLPLAGFIFHMSRCGSTAVSQTLAALPEHVVISEAGPLDALARAHLRAPTLPASLHTVWLRAMAAALAQPRQGGESRCFIKFDARTALHLPLLRQAFPAVPWIFLYRDPVEVMVSLHHRPSATTTPGMGPGLPDVPPEATASMEPEEYAARILGLLCESAAAQFPGAPALLVEYRELPDAVWQRVLPHFCFGGNAAAMERMRHAAALDAKDRTRAFVPDSARRQKEASAAIRLAAGRWAAPRYAELERLRAHASGR